MMGKLSTIKWNPNINRRKEIEERRIVFLYNTHTGDEKYDGPRVSKQDKRRPSG